VLGRLLKLFLRQPHSSRTSREVREANWVISSMTDASPAGFVSTLIIHSPLPAGKARD